MSQRAFSQGKELWNVSNFSHQLRVRECKTALESTPSEGKGQRVKNVFNLLMFLTLCCWGGRMYQQQVWELKLTASLLLRHGLEPMSFQVQTVSTLFFWQTSNPCFYWPKHIDGFWPSSVQQGCCPQEIRITSSPLICYIHPLKPLSSSRRWFHGSSLDCKLCLTEADRLPSTGWFTLPMRTAPVGFAQQLASSALNLQAPETSTCALSLLQPCFYF